MSKPVHPSFVRDLDAYCGAILRRERLLVRLEAKRQAAAKPQPNRLRDQP